MRVFRQAHRVLGIILVVAMLAVPAVAVDCTPPPITNADAATEALNNLRGDGCLGGNACTEPLCADVQTFVEKWCGRDTGAFCRPSALSAALFSEAKELIKDVRDKGESLPANGTAVPQLRGMLARWDGTFSTIGTTPVNGARLTEWETGGMRLFPDTLYMIDIEETFPRECGTPERCQKSFASVRDVYTEAALTHRVLALLAGADVQDAFDRLKILDARWHAYHNETRAIYPWELLVNGYLVHESQDKGFAEPPNRQILFLHPSAGLEYRFSENDRMQEALLLDVIGFYWWKWGGENETEVKRPLGFAVAAWYDGVEPSYGVTAHFPKNWSFGVGADRHGKVSLALSVDFGNYLLEKSHAVDSLKTKFE
jgi:hypothetical protein